MARRFLHHPHHVMLPFKQFQQQLWNDPTWQVLATLSRDELAYYQ
jgi:hypothetical protein